VSVKTTDDKQPPSVEAALYDRWHTPPSTALVHAP
jgi:hypothetical protein